MRISLLIFLVSCLLLPPSMQASPAEADCRLPLPELFQRVSPSVVGISAVRIDPFKITGRFDLSTGTGLVIQPDGLILTSSHVVFNTRSIMVTLAGNQTVEAALVGADPVLDIAAIRIPVGDKPLRAAVLGDSDRLRVGEEVAAIGNPLGIEKTLVRGIVSGLNRILPISPMSLRIPLIQTDASIYPGNSGGPLVDRCGRVVGIVTSMLLDEARIGFALPINIVLRSLPQLIDSGRVIRPWLGIRGKYIQAKLLQRIFNFDIVDGFLVETVDPDSPAETAGLQGGKLPITIAGEEFLMGGDIIYEINGVPLDDPMELENILHTLKIGDAVRLGVFRNGERSQMELTASERPLLPGDLPAAQGLEYAPRWKSNGAPL